MPSKVLVTRKFAPKAMDLLRSCSDIELVIWEDDESPAPRAWVLEHVKGCHGALVMLTDKVDQEFLDAAGSTLKIVSTFSVGYDHISVPLLRERGIRIGYTPDVLTDAVADLTVMLILMAMRRVGEAIRAVDQGKWPSLGWSPSLLTGPQIRGKTIAFLGFGRISHAVLQRLLAFQPSSQVIYHARSHPSSDQLAEWAKMFPGVTVERVELDELAERAEVLIVLCAGGEATRGLVGESFLKKMGEGRSQGLGVVVNAARGTIIDSTALSKALDLGWISGAGLDVLDGEPNIPADHPLVLNERCVVLPHLGSATIETREGMALLAAQNVIGGVRDEEELAVELKA